MIRSEKAEYQENTSFWTNKGDNLTVIGDYLGRLPAIELLNPQPGEMILDAGCGAGFISRRLAKAGAKVYGCDREEKMLAKAIETEEKEPLGIKYRLADITSLPYRHKKFDAVACVAVLIHDSLEECDIFFNEAWWILKSKGRIVISIMHPFLYDVTSPNRKGQASWAQYRPLENKPVTESQRFEEVYRNADGKDFISTVWCHPTEVITKLLKQNGFSIIQEQSTYVTSKVLMACFQAGPTNYPAFWQVLAVKN